MKLFECQNCGQPLYFENTRCESCGLQLGYLPARETVTALWKQGKRGLRALAEPQGPLPLLRQRAARCLQLAGSRRQPEQFCAACRHNRTIPDLSQPDNLANWRKIEVAKHRLFYTLLKLRLPLSDQDRGSRDGLAFDFLAQRRRTARTPRRS